MTHTAIVALCVVTLSMCSSAHAEPPAPIVKTEQGLVQGAMADGVLVFKGLPYAAPPVGPLRWRPPQPAAKWQGTRVATKFGPGCPTIDGRKIQQGQQLSGAYDIFIGVPLAPGSSEDCLHLNVWAPVDAKRAAVMVWIQPLGPASTPLYDGSAFARDGVVMVTMDYRQLTMGNFAHPALIREAGPKEPLGRYQTMDLMQALRWVKDNIAAFGGDPGNVTVFGLSAGGSSLVQLLTIPAATGLVDKAIVQSGGSWGSPFSLSQLAQLGSWAATQAGLPGKDATSEQLRALPAERLPQLGLYSIDGRLQPENAATAMAAGRMADVPLMIGWTDFDGSSLRATRPEVLAENASDALKAAYAADDKAGADLGYQMYTDSHVGAPARWIADKAATGAPSYLYLFSYVPTRNRGKVRGAAHGEDMSYVFDTWDKAYPQLVLSEEDRAATRMMRSCWISFAKTGKPRCEGAPDWPRYTRKDDQLMELTLQPRVRKEFRRQQLDAQEAAMQDIISQAAKSVDDLMLRIANGEMPAAK